MPSYYDEEKKKWVNYRPGKGAIRGRPAKDRPAPRIIGPAAPHTGKMKPLQTPHPPPSGIMHEVTPRTIGPAAPHTGKNSPLREQRKQEYEAKKEHWYWKKLGQKPVDEI